MRRPNHASRFEGIAKTKLQASRASDTQTLQSQVNKAAKKRLSLSGIEILHGRLLTRVQFANMVEYGVRVERADRAFPARGFCFWPSIGSRRPPELAAILATDADDVCHDAARKAFDGHAFSAWFARPVTRPGCHRRAHSTAWTRRHAVGSRRPGAPPDQCRINVKKLLSIRRRPHMTQCRDRPER